jgi:poly-gamma-glutamate synthesis protein (capsule biosynthesis protein)
MLFAGDVAVPTAEHSQVLAEVLERYSHLFKNKTLICNYEGLISETLPPANEPVLSNHPSVLEILTRRGPLVLGLANNHVLDLPQFFDSSVQIFLSNQIPFAGAGKSPETARQHIEFYEDGVKIVLFNACWDFLLYDQDNPKNGIYVNVINEIKLVEQISKRRLEESDSIIVVFLHWSFDLETLPFPMYRQFAMSLIDAGASIVVGAHSHCVQGGEKYGNGHIVYGLGNFFMPHGVFAQGKINYPPLAALELVLDWDVKTSRVLCHWFEYQYQEKKHELIYLDTEDFENSVRLNQYSPYRGMNQAQYLPFYRSNRRKKFLIPVFKDYRNNRRNRFYTFLLKLRARFARSLAKWNIIKWQN